MSENNYTFGDSDLASLRLRKLADVYEAETISLLQRSNAREPRLACDLGCGPGWSTRLIQRVIAPNRTIGLDASAKYIAEAGSQGDDLEFAVWDVTQAPFPIPAPDFLFCRFLLTHLQSPREVLATWKKTASPHALLLIHETESLESDHPALRRYYELVGRMQEHYGQNLWIGSALANCLEQAGWQVIESVAPLLEKSAGAMAELHLANLQTWRHNEFASRSFDPAEIDALKASLTQIASGREAVGVVWNKARQIVARSH